MKTDRLPFFVRDMLVAASLLTRLPLPRLSEQAYSNAARAVWAYPLVGLLVSATAAFLGYVTYQLGLPAPLAGGVTLAALMISTGAMHEDGLSDTADGFWGGYTTERRLEIMKDSQIGTYGTLALILAAGSRWMCYAALIPVSPLAIVAVAAVSRSAMPPLMLWLINARTGGLSRSVGRPLATPVAIGAGIGIGTTLVLLGAAGAIACAAVVMSALSVGAFAQHKIGGQTGDVLGATQQVCEIAALMVLVAVVA